MSDKQENTTGRGADKLHCWFGLSYAQYLTIPRTAMQSMPDEWQGKMAKLLKEMDERIDWYPREGRYWVQLKDYRGHYVKDSLADYERGRRRLELKPKRILTFREKFRLVRNEMKLWILEKWYAAKNWIRRKREHLFDFINLPFTDI